MEVLNSPRPQTDKYLQANFWHHKCQHASHPPLVTSRQKNMKKATAQGGRGSIRLRQNLLHKVLTIGPCKQPLQCLFHQAHPCPLWPSRELNSPSACFSQFPLSGIPFLSLPVYKVQLHLQLRHCLLQEVLPGLYFSASSTLAPAHTYVYPWGVFSLELHPFSQL